MVAVTGTSPSSTRTLQPPQALSPPQGNSTPAVEELVGQRLPRAGMEFELHERLRANRAIASTLACGVPRGTSQPAPQM